MAVTHRFCPCAGLRGFAASGSAAEFAVVVTVAVTVSAALLFTTCAFSASVVKIAQVAFGASVSHVKNAKPLPAAKPGVKLLAFPVVAFALALIAIGRGALSGQFLEVERKRDRIARHVCLALGIVVLAAYAASWLL